MSGSNVCFIHVFSQYWNDHTGQSPEAQAVFLHQHFRGFRKQEFSSTVLSKNNFAKAYTRGPDQFETDFWRCYGLSWEIFITHPHLLRTYIIALPNPKDHSSKQKLCAIPSFKKKMLSFANTTKKSTHGIKKNQQVVLLMVQKSQTTTLTCMKP